MKSRNILLNGLLILSLAIMGSGCRKKDKFANIPGPSEIYSNIQYLDSLARSEETDSIDQVLSTISARLASYNNNIRSANEKLIIDSLTAIRISVKEYVQYCTDIQPDLLVLQQDTRNLVDQYQSGKIKLAGYISKLMEEDELLINMSSQLYTMRDRTFLLLDRYNYLSGLLESPEMDTPQDLLQPGF
jgi:hypothetical protein